MAEIKQEFKVGDVVWIFGDDGPVQATLCKDKDDNNGVYLVKEHTPRGWHIGVRTVFSDYERCMLDYLCYRLSDLIATEKLERSRLVVEQGVLEKRIAKLEADYNLLKTYVESN
jgi:hypothetical protein